MPRATKPAASSVSAIILAAGIGRRLGNSAPKVLLDFDGKTLLARHIAALHGHGVHDIAITVGHRPDLIRDELGRIGALDGVALIENPRYREGSVVSLAVQRERLLAGTTVLLMDGDVLYDSRMIGRLLAASPENVLLFDEAIEPGDEPVKICLRGKTIVDFAKLPDHAHDRHGESVGFFRFSAGMAAAVAERTGAYIQAGRANAEYEAALRELILAQPERFGYE